LKKLVTLLITLAIGVFPMFAYAQETKETVVLKPTPDTDKIFTKVIRTVVSNDEDIIRIEGNAGSNPEGYKISIDEENGTYTATRLPDKQIEAILLESQEVSPMASHYRSVTAITDDPAGVDLAKHTHRLNFTTGSGKATYSSRTKSAWAANPSSLGTHWYVDENVYTGLGYLDGNRTVYSSSRAKFHNYDFGDDSTVTRVTHYITIEGYYTGGSNYYVDWSRSGEGWNLLDLDIVTSSN